MGLLDGLDSVLTNPAVEALLPAALGAAGAGLTSPRRAGTRGAIGSALSGGAQGLAEGMRTAAESQNQQQELALKQQRQAAEMQQLAVQTQGLQTQNEQNQLILGNEQVKQKYIQSLPPDKQALFIADPKGYLDLELATKAAPASIAALKATGKYSPEALKAFAGLDPVTLHDITGKALDAYTAGKETDLQKVHDGYVKSGMSDMKAWQQAAMDLKAAPQIAVTEARGETTLDAITARGEETRKTNAAKPAPTKWQVGADGYYHGLGVGADGKPTDVKSPVKAPPKGQSVFQANKTIVDSIKNATPKDYIVSSIDPDDTVHYTYGGMIKIGHAPQSRKVPGAYAMSQAAGTEAAGGDAGGELSPAAKAVRDKYIGGGS